MFRLLHDTTRASASTRLSVLVVLLLVSFAMFGCSAEPSASAEEEYSYDLSTEEGMRMDANSKFLIEHLEMITFDEYHLWLFANALEASGCGNIIEAEAEYDSAKQADYDAGEHFCITLKDDLGNTYIAEVIITGYCFEYVKRSSDGSEKNYAITPPASDPK